MVMETENTRQSDEGIYRSCDNNGKKGQNAARYTLLAIFAVYIIILLYALFFRSPYDLGLPYWRLISENHSLVPFNELKYQLHLARYSDRGALVRYGIKNIAGNLVLFFPMGIFLPCIFKKLRRAYKTIPLIMGIVAAAELIQLFTLRGFADIDDLILNTAGAAMGYFIFYIVSASTRE